MPRICFVKPSDEDRELNTDFLKDLNEKAKESLAPMNKVGELMTSSMQETFKAQMESAKKYSDFASARFKAFTEVKDPESLQDFFKEQMEAFGELNEQMMTDIQALSDAGSKFREELEEIMKSASEPKTEAKPAAKATSKAK